MRRTRWQSGAAGDTKKVGGVRGTISRELVLLKLVPGQALHIASILRQHGKNGHVTIRQS